MPPPPQPQLPPSAWLFGGAAGLAIAAVAGVAVGAMSRSRLIRLSDRNLNYVDVLYDQQGRLQALYDKYGQTVVQLHYEAAHTARASKVSRIFLTKSGAPAIERNELLVSYRYTDNGQLQEVLDATGQLVRRFSYTEEGYLKRHQLASGAVREYAWARYTLPEKRPAPRRADGTPYRLPPLLEPQTDHEWRVIRHWGSDGMERTDSQR